MSGSEASDEIERRFADDAALARAVRRAVREAVRVHKQAGNRVAAWRDGSVVLLAPDEVILPEDGAAD